MPRYRPPQIRELACIQISLTTLKETAMATPAKKAKAAAKPLAKFQFPMTAEVRIPDFTPFDSLKALDLDLLGKGKHRIEIGTMTGGCCRKLVYAVVKNGVVTAVEAEPCAEATRTPSKEVKALFAQARKSIKDPGKWEPIPVAKLADVVMLRPTKVGTGAGCFYICIWNYCLFCCYRGLDSGCWIETRTASPD
jgi:hypothetical protein